MKHVTRLIFVLALIVSACSFLFSGCAKKDQPAPVVTVPEEEVVLPDDDTEDIEVVTEEDRLVNDGSWVVTASSTEKALHPELAVDGNPGTRWSSAFNNDEWWQIDFGQEHMLGNLAIQWEDAYAAAYAVNLSTDGETWDVIYSTRSGKAGVTTIQFERRPVRYVRIDCERRATEWGFSIMDVGFNVPAPPRMTATASSGRGDYAPHYAIDGDMSTRWSSDFSDAEWWQVEFEEPRTVAGMKISWETAFAEKYEIAVSVDGSEWRTVYVVEEGDGQTDILFFAPVKTKFLRVVCNQRGTGWGNSMWEVVFFDKKDQLQGAASSSVQGRGVASAIDGYPGSSWKSAGDGEQWFQITLPREMHLGGMELIWGTGFAVVYDVEWSADGEQWTPLYHETFGNGEKDYIFFPAIHAQHLRIVCRKSNAGKGYELAQIELKSGEEQASPLREYQARARDAQRGHYPMWLTRQQEFWTVVGLPEDDQESLLGETGTFEPFKNAFSVQPFVVKDGGIISWADVSLSQQLEKDYLPLPSVRWTADGWGMHISAFPFGSPGAAFTAVRYRFINAGKEPLRSKLVLAVRPVLLNPVWQHGGMGRITFAECFTHAEPAMIKLNQRTGLLLPTTPSSMAVSRLGDGDITDYLAQGRFPETTRASESDGLLGVGVSYDLDIPADGFQDVVVVFPLHETATIESEWKQDPASAFETNWGKSVADWEKQLNRLVIDIPEPRLIQTMKSNLGYVLINRDPPWFKPGSRNYNHSWVRDGALTGVAALRLGKSDIVKAFIENFSLFVNEDGWVPYIITEDGKPIGYNPNRDGGEGHEFDSQGQFVFIVRQYYDFTGDEELVRSVYPVVVRALEYGREIRKRRLTDPYRDTVYWGILPHSNSHEGYFPAKHSYWDNFWMLRGLKDGVYLAEQMGDPETAAWMREEEEALRECLLDSILAVIERDNISYIPGCAELGDEDPTSTSVAVMACDEADHLPQSVLLETFNRYQERIKKRYEGIADTFTPYEARNADVFVRLGQRDRALALLRYFMADSMLPYAWNHMAEVVHATKRAPSYIGDMPHTWVGSDYINAVRSLFSYVHDDTLFLAAGVDPAWLESGVRVENLPTQYGEVAYTIKREEGSILFAADGDVKPPKGFVWPLPEELQSRQVTMNGEPADVINGGVRFQELPVTIRIQP